VGYKKNTKNTTVGTVPKFNRGTVETKTKLTPLTHKYMTTHFIGLIQAP